MDIPAVVRGYGTNAPSMFEIGQFDECNPLSQSVHLAFNGFVFKKCR